MCPGETARNAERRGRQHASRPHRRPSPARTRQGRHVYNAVYSRGFSKVVGKDFGGRSQTLLQALPQSLPHPASVRLRLRMAGGPGLPGLRLHPSLEGESVRGGPAASPLLPPSRASALHPPPGTGASPSRSSAPPRCRSASFCRLESKEEWAGLA